ncbi:MAG TPA: hypothetical protein VGI10_28455 [Polyangiaceae bacterium]
MSSPAPISAAADAVLTFLESVGRRSEAEFYLRVFLKVPKQSFAIIAPGSTVIRYALGSLVEQLKFLADLGLYAPVVLGLFDPEAGPSCSERLLKRLPAAGIDACPHEMSEEGLAARLGDELRANRVPVLHFRPLDGETLDERVADLGALAHALDTRKLVLLRRRGGLRSRAKMDTTSGQFLVTDAGRISIVNLRTDHETISASRALPKRDAELLETAAKLIALSQPNPLLASVTSPLNLLKELFTVKGAGTLVKVGSAVQRFGSYAELDVERLKHLLEASFGRQLESSFFEQPPLALYVEANYRGAAIVQAAPPAPYLSKFAVEPEAQGEGLGRDLWQALTRDYPALFWRARADNAIAPWYASICDGLLRFPEWHVYFRGIAPSSIPEVVELARSRPSDFVTSR